MAMQSAADGGTMVDQQWAPISGVLTRIPVARVARGPGGLHWQVDAVLAPHDDQLVPAFLLRPCVRFAFVPAEVARVRKGLASTLEHLLVRPGTRPRRDALSLDAADAELGKGQGLGLVVDLRHPEWAPAERRLLVNAPWALLLDESPAELGMLELSYMDRVDAALIALLEARCSVQGVGRARGVRLPGPEADLVGVLVQSGLTVVAAAERVARLPDSPSFDSLIRLHEGGVRARQRGPKAVLVPDLTPTDTNLVDWLRHPRTARLLRVVTGGIVDHLHVGIASPRTIGGWMECRMLPFWSVRADLAPGQAPPVGLSIDDIDADARTVQLFGFAETAEALIARHAPRARASAEGAGSP